MPGTVLSVPEIEPTCFIAAGGFGAGGFGEETTAGSLNGGSKITGSGCEYWDYNDPNMWNNDHWDNDWKHDNDNWSHWDSASGVRVSVLACLLAGAAAAL